jgi:hypothetical protein
MTFDETMLRETIKQAVERAIADQLARIIAEEVRRALQERESDLRALAKAMIAASFRQIPS